MNLRLIRSVFASKLAPPTVTGSEMAPAAHIFKCQLPRPHLPRGEIQQNRKRFIQRFASTSAQDVFYSQGVKFTDLGLSTEVANSAQLAGFQQPARVQAQAIPVVLSGRDVAIASETGSGKTLAYLLPIIQSLQQRQTCLRDSGRGTTTWFRHCAIILCPNMELCEQVAVTANSLVGASSLPLLAAHVISSRNPPPQNSPTDIIVSTPGSLCRLLDEAGDAYGLQWDPSNLAQCVRHFVVDEADALFSSDSFFKPLRRLLDLLRGSDRMFAARAVCSTTGISAEDFEALKRGVKIAAYKGGARAMLEEGWIPPREDISLDKDGAYHRCRSYIMSGATFPRGGEKSVSLDIQKRFPDMEWLQGEQLHASKSSISHAWVALQSSTDRSEAIAAVVAAVRSSSGYRGNTGDLPLPGHTLVFCRDTASAKMMHEELQLLGLEALLYHKKLPQADRSAALKCMREQQGCVLVCTDAASRGLDFPSISHVIQADFADNAVDFLHRIGRTARGHRQGKVTSCYTPEKQQLAMAIKAAIDSGQPIEGTFSRNRSFSGKFKRYGRFIPRGVVA